MMSLVQPTLFNRLTDLGLKFCSLLFPALIVYILVTDSDGCGDVPRDFLFFPIAISAAFGLALTWCIIDKQKRDYSKLQYGLQVATRYFLAYIIMQYGMVKVFDVQFGVSISQLDSNVVDMRPMSVAWTFFGYSRSYQMFIGLGQIVASLLLLFRRTSTLGAILMMTILANIVYVNFVFDICVKFFSVTYLGMAVYLLLDDAARLANFFIHNKTAEQRTYPVLFAGRTGKRVFKIVGVLAGLFATCYPVYYTFAGIKKYGVGKHSNVYGVWKVDSIHSSSDSLQAQLQSDSAGWKKMIFDDYNSGIVKSWQKTSYYNYTVNDSIPEIIMQRTRPDTLVTVKTTYRLDKDTLYLNGTYNKDTISARMILQRKYFIR
jgi:hypothetical protein